MRETRLVKALLLSAALLAGLAPALGQRDTIRTQVDLVVVPTSVRDGSGKLISHLVKEDFLIFEDGRQQDIQQFSTDPASLSAVVIVDTGIGGTALRRFSSSKVGLSSVFVTDFDEAAVYRFDNFVSQVADFTKDQKSFERGIDAIAKIGDKKGEPNGQPLVILPGRGPRWLRWILDRGNAPRPLNEALWTSAADLEKRSEENRKIIVVISDGQIAQAVGKYPWSGPTATTVDQTRDRLVQDKIQLYGVTVGIGLLGSATSGLKSYASATGGEVYDGRTQSGMETAFSRIGEQARYQYVLSYVSNNETPRMLPVVRKIEVRTKDPALRINHRKTYLQYTVRR